MATKKVIEKETHTCIICDRSVEKSRNFYKTSNPKYKSGVLPFCKDCVKESFKSSFRKTSDITQSIMATSMRFDMPFDERNISEYNKSSKTSVDDAMDVFNKFITTNQSIGKKLLSDDGFNYEEASGKLLQLSESKTDENEKIYLDSTSDNIEITSTEVEFFGQGYSLSEYKTLTKSFLTLIQNYTVSEYIASTVFKDLCFFDMKIEQAKLSGAPEKDIIAMIKARRDLWKDSNLDSFEKKNTDKVDGLGMLIKKMETERPPEILPEWDNNKLEQVATMFAGHILKGEGIVNDITKEFDEMMEPYSVDIGEFVNVESEVVVNE